VPNTDELQNLYFHFEYFAAELKLQKHLSLLREEYVKLQTKFEEMSRKYEIASAASPQSGGDGFVFRLLSIVSQLYDKSQYRCFTF